MDTLDRRLFLSTLVAAAAVLSELMHDDGTMMRLPDVRRFAAEHGLKVGTIADLIAYRLARDAFIQRVASARLPTPLAEFTIHGYVDEAQGGEHVALSLGDLGTGEPVLVRLHSECLTGDALHSLRCDCGFQRDAALRERHLYIRLLGRLEALQLDAYCVNTRSEEGRDPASFRSRNKGAGALRSRHRDRRAGNRQLLRIENLPLQAASRLLRRCSSNCGEQQSNQ